MEHRIYKGIARVWGDGPTVMKGYNVEGVARIIKGKWDSFADPVGIGLDATKFDMHVSAAMLEWEHSVYQDLFPGDRRLRKLLRWQVDNVGRGYAEDGKLKYKVRGKRFSGDMNTALGNCLIMCAMVHAYAKVRGVECKLVNNGDDCVVFMERKEEEKFRKDLSVWFLRLGFRMTVEATVDVLERVEFCQMRPVFNGETYVMVRNAHVALQKDSMSTIGLDHYKTLECWLTAVGNGGVAICAGVPVMQEFYQCYVRSGKGRVSRIGDDTSMQTGLALMSIGMEGTYREVTAGARLSAFLAWGITPDEQIALEREFGATTIEYNNPDDIDDTNLYYNSIIHELTVPR